MIQAHYNSKKAEPLNQPQLVYQNQLAQQMIQTTTLYQDHQGMNLNLELFHQAA